VNTGETIGAFTEDRDAAVRGVLGEKARMIPVHIAVRSGESERKLNIDVLDLASLTPQAVTVALYDALLESMKARRRPATTLPAPSTWRDTRRCRSIYGRRPGMYPQR